MPIDELYQLFLQSTGVSTDTRTVKEGNIFFALKGDHFNGNRFANNALEAGASKAIIDEKKFEGPNTILVSNALETLQELAKYHRAKLTIPVIGLTGSNGKTTTKELIASVLSTKYNTQYTKGNLNNHIGVPLSILSIKLDHQVAVIEMGANHQKEIEFLSSISLPDFGYITNFGKAHLEGFGGVDGVIKGKSELYQNLREHHKIALVNINDPKQVELTEGIERVLFGSEKTAYPYKPVHETENGYIGVDYNGLEIQSNLTGAYNFNNICAAITLGLHFDVPISDVKSAIEGYNPTNNRSQIQKTEKNRLIVDAYNANPSSMKAAILNFEKLEAKSKWIIAGDMFEMGEYEAEEHQKLANLMNNPNFEMVILVGQAFSKVHTPALQIETTEELLRYLRKSNPSNKTILIKGSRGMTLEKAIPYL